MGLVIREAVTVKPHPIKRHPNSIQSWNDYKTILYLLVMSTILQIVLLLNTIWFGAGFWFFGIRSRQATRLVIKKEHLQDPISDVLAHSLKFLGGLNLVLSVLSSIILIADSLFLNATEKGALALVFTLAHATQFYYNLPIALQEFRKEQPLWPVLKGRMRFIFITDATLAIFNLLSGIYWLTPGKAV